MCLQERGATSGLPETRRSGAGTHSYRQAPPFLPDTDWPNLPWQKVLIAGNILHAYQWEGPPRAIDAQD